MCLYMDYEMEGVELCDWTERSYSKSSYFKHTKKKNNKNQFNGVLMLWSEIYFD